MRRTQIYLDPELSTALEREACKRGVSKAELIRLAARELLQREGRHREDPILGIVGLGTGAQSRTSEDHDQVLADHALGTPPQ